MAQCARSGTEQRAHHERGAAPERRRFALKPARLLPSSGARRLLARAATLCAALLLAACATHTLVIDDPDWLRHEQAVAALQDWQLSGRLVVRQDGNADTVNINWRQLDQNFDLRLFGSLGLGAASDHRYTSLSRCWSVPGVSDEQQVSTHTQFCSFPSAIIFLRRSIAVLLAARGLDLLPLCISRQSFCHCVFCLPVA